MSENTDKEVKKTTMMMMMMANWLFCTQNPEILDLQRDETADLHTLLYS